MQKSALIQPRTSHLKFGGGRGPLQKIGFLWSPNLKLSRQIDSPESIETIFGVRVSSLGDLPTQNSRQERGAELVGLVAEVRASRIPAKRKLVAESGRRPSAAASQ